MEVEDDANISSADPCINEKEWFIKPYQDKPMTDVDWSAKYTEQRWPEEHK